MNVKQLKEIIRDLPDDTIVTIPCDIGQRSSIMVNVNFADIAPAQYSYSENSYITIGVDLESDSLSIRELVGFHQWEEKN